MISFAWPKCSGHMWKILVSQMKSFGIDFFPVDPINQRIPPMADSQLWRIQMYFCSVVFCFNKNIGFNIGFKAVTPCMKWFSMALWETRGKNTIYSPLSLFFFCLQAHWIKIRGFYSSILLSLKMMRYLNTHAKSYFSLIVKFCSFSFLFFPFFSFCKLKVVSLHLITRFSGRNTFGCNRFSQGT